MRLRVQWRLLAVLESFSRSGGTDLGICGSKECDLDGVLVDLF
jgi:hypothetical protein